MPGAIRCIGDSLTSGGGSFEDSYPGRLQRALGRPVINDGVPGQTSAQIAARVGALPVAVEVDGGAIPASGPAACAGVRPDVLGPKHKGALPGALAGVDGRLLHAKTGAYAFLRDAAGAPVPCPPGAAFVPRKVPADLHVLWMGENDPLNAGGRAGILASLAACIGELDAGKGRFVVLGLFAGAGEEAGARRRRLKLELNASLAQAWPGRVLDVHAPLLAAGDPASPEDGADLAQGVVPRSLRQDHIHPNAAGNAVIARLVQAFVESRGW